MRRAIENLVTIGLFADAWRLSQKALCLYAVTEDEDGPVEVFRPGETPRMEIAFPLQ